MPAPTQDEMNTLILQLAVAAKNGDGAAATMLLDDAVRHGIEPYDIIGTMALTISTWYDNDPDVGSTWTDDVQQTLLRRALGEDN